MNFPWLIIYLYIAAGFECFLCLVALTRRSVSAARPYALSSFITAVWILTAALDLGTADLPLKIRLLQIRYLFVPYLVLLWLETVYRSVRGRKFLTGWVLAAALIVPASTSALAWLPGPGFNPFFRYHFWVATAQGEPVLRFDRGPWSGVYNLYIYGVTFASWYVLARSYSQAGWERKPRLLMLAAWMCSMLTDVLWTFGLSWPPGFQSQSVMLPLVNTVVAYAIFRGRLFDLAPVVRASLVETLDEYVIVVDLDRRIVDLNRAAAQALNCEPAAALGRPAESVLAAWPPVIARLGQSREGRHEITLGDRVHELVVHPAKDGSSRQRATVLVLRDLTNQKLAETNAMRAVVQAKAADEAKGQFLAVMSHEIRTPISGIIGFAQILSETKLSEQQGELLGYLAECGNSLMVLVDDLLDFSKIEAGQLQFERIAVDLRVLLAQTCSALLPRARAQGLLLNWTVEADVPRLVYSDPVRLRQIINNLTANAVKFTEAGSVSVKLAIRAETGAAEAAVLEIQVADTGIGLTPDDIKRVVLPFVQADSSTARRYGGTGLGLAITSQLCALMGGRLDIASQPGRGSTFTATVNVALEAAGAKAAPAPPPPPAAIALPPLRILVVEDNLVLERMITTLLSQAGHTVVSASGGEAAIKLLETAAPLDAILLDLQMAGMDGYTTAREIRRREQGGPAAQHIIALTAHALKGERQKCLEAGMNDYLAKPVNRAELWAALARAVRAPEHSPSTP